MILWYVDHLHIHTLLTFLLLFTLEFLPTSTELSIEIATSDNPRRNCNSLMCFVGLPAHLHDTIGLDFACNITILYIFYIKKMIYIY